MDAREVLDVLTVLDEEVLNVVIEGGWGVDALLGAQHRDHEDLDLLVWQRELPKILDALGAVGFAPDPASADHDEPPQQVTVVDRIGRRIDMTLLVTDDDGNHWVGSVPTGADGSDSNARSFVPASAITTGWVGGRPVRCIDPVLQVKRHDHYEPATRDRLDMSVLHHALGVGLPHQYR